MNRTAGEGKHGFMVAMRGNEAVEAFQAPEFRREVCQFAQHAYPIGYELMANEFSMSQHRNLVIG